MKIKSFTFILMTGLAALLSCSKNSGEQKPAGYVTISATMDEGDGTDTKTYLTDVRVKWQESDVIALWYGTLGTSMYGEPYTVLSIDEKDARKATFRGFAPARDCYMGVYPYSASDGCSKKGKLTVTLPTEQTATAGSFGPGANVAVAYSATTDLLFQNIGALMAVHLTDVGTHTVTSMRLTGTSALSGQVEIKQATLPTVDAVVSGENYVELTGSIIVGNTYYFVVLPGDHTGFTLTLTDEDGNTATATSAYAVTIDRNSNTLIADLTVPEIKWEAPAPVDTDEIVLNEINGNGQKFIELYNAGATTVSLTGWTVQKDEAVVWTGTTESIDAGGYLVLYSSKNKDGDANPEGAVTFTGGLSAKKNVKVDLYNASAELKDSFARGEKGSGWGDITLPENSKNSFSRVPDGDEGIWKYAAPTIGETNGGQTGTIEQYAMVKDVLILNELNGNKNQKFIELRNVSGASYSLEGVTLHKDGKLVWTGVADLSVATDGYVLLYSSDVTKTGGAHEGYDARLTFSSGLSASKAVNVQLFNAAGAPLDIFNYATYSGSPAPASYGRNADAAWYYQDATPGTVNTDGTTPMTGLE